MANPDNPHITDHLANERTFLAWIRTAIGVMGFGFVVVKFSLFVRQLALVLEGGKNLPPQRGYSVAVGIVLVAFGGIMSVLAYIRFLRTQKQISKNEYARSSLLLSLLVVFIFLICLMLIAYLILTT